MKKLKPPKPEQSRSISLPKLPKPKEQEKNPVFSKEFIKLVQKRSIPSHDFLFQAKPAKIFKVSTKSIIVNNSSPHLDQVKDANGSQSRYLFCNFKSRKKSFPKLMMKGLRVYSCSEGKEMQGLQGFKWNKSFY